MADIARLIQLIEPEAQALGFELVRVAMIAFSPIRSARSPTESTALGTK